MCTFHKMKQNKTNQLGPVWYMCLKTENCCLKIFLKIHVDEKVRSNT